MKTKCYQNCKTILKQKHMVFQMLMSCLCIHEEDLFKVLSFGASRNAVKFRSRWLCKKEWYYLFSHMHTESNKVLKYSKFNLRWFTNSVNNALYTILNRLRIWFIYRYLFIWMKTTFMDQSPEVNYIHV